MTFTAFIEKLIRSTGSILDEIESYPAEDSTDQQILDYVHLQLEMLFASLKENLK
jgi:hypothetical protein